MRQNFIFTHSLTILLLFKLLEMRGSSRKQIRNSLSTSFFFPLYFWKLQMIMCSPCFPICFLSPFPRNGPIKFSDCIHALTNFTVCHGISGISCTISLFFHSITSDIIQMFCSTTTVIAGRTPQNVSVALSDFQPLNPHYQLKSVEYQLAMWRRISKARDWIERDILHPIQHRCVLMKRAGRKGVEGLTQQFHRLGSILQQAADRDR